MSTFKTRSVGRSKFGRSKKRIRKTRKSINTRVRNLERKQDIYNHPDLAAGIITDVDLFTTAGVIQLNDIDEGNSEHERNGSGIFMRHLSMSGTISQDVEVVGTTLLHRLVVVVEYSHAVGTDPTWLNVFDNTSVYALRNYDGRTKYNVIFDKVYSTVRDESATVRSLIPFQIFRKLNKRVAYTGNVGTSVIKNALWFMYVSTAATNQVDLDYNFHVTYED